MPRVHEKIAEREAERIRNNQSLLSESDRFLVESVRNYVGHIQLEAGPLVDQLNEIVQDLNKNMNSEMTLGTSISELEAIMDDLDYRGVDFILNKLITCIDEDIFQLSEDIHTREDIERIVKIDTNDINSEDNKEKIRSLLLMTKDEYQKKLIQCTEESEKLLIRQNDLNSEITELKDALENYRRTINVNFDIDDNFNLTKIAKAKGERAGPEFSVVFSIKGGKTQPFIMYRGKEYEGRKRQLGEGGFGKVKLAQDYNTNEIVAVKVQDSTMLPEEILQKEKDMLGVVGRLKGSARRKEQNKDYIFQDLHYGNELKKILSKQKLGDETILEMLSQAAILLQELHDNNLIHRDIKLENFMWDQEELKCVLIDLAFIENVQGDEIIKKRDEAGSEAYLAPEVAERGEYSKRSDIYAFGVMVQELLEKNPTMNQALKSQIEKLTAANVDDRAKNLNEFIQELAKLKIDQNKQQTLSEKGANTVPKQGRVKGMVASYEEKISALKKENEANTINKKPQTRPRKI